MLTTDAYLLVYLPSDSAPLFPTQENGSHQVHTLGAVYSIPVHPELSLPAIKQLEAIQVSITKSHRQVLISAGIATQTTAERSEMEFPAQPSTDRQGSIGAEAPG